MWGPRRKRALANLGCLLGYAVEHSAGVLLFDTGLGEGDAEADAHYRPVRRPLPDALRTAKTAADYALPNLVDFDGALYREMDGETEILPDVLAIPTPGHTDGHQAIAVRGADGTVVLAEPGA